MGNLPQANSPTALLPGPSPALAVNAVTDNSVTKIHGKVKTFSQQANKGKNKTKQNHFQQRKNYTDTRYDLLGPSILTQIPHRTNVNCLSPPERGSLVLLQRDGNGKMGETRLCFLSLQAIRKAISIISK